MIWEQETNKNDTGFLGWLREVFQRGEVCATP